MADNLILDILGALGAATAGGGAVWLVGQRKRSVPALTLPAQDEGHLGGSFRVVNDFSIEGFGQYWAGHEYRLTRHIKNAVDVAIGRGDAVMVKT